jgi:membrane protease YdiL (CAAX protease family)
MENVESNSVDTRSVDKKRLFAFIAFAYGISFVMMIPMYIGKMKGLDITQIVNAQMCSPAAGVAIGYLLFMKGEKRVPKFFMVVLVLNYIIQLFLGIASVFFMPFSSSDVIDLAEILGSSGMSSDITGVSTKIPVGQLYNLIGQSVLVEFSLLLWIAYFVAGKERRKFVGLSRNREGLGILMVLLFIALYSLRTLGPVFAEAAFTNTMPQTLDAYIQLTQNSLFWASVISLPINYVLTVIAFFGEEYGWRSYLQPIMQKKFGLKLGVILLGIVWGLWHIPVDTMFYTEDSVPQMIIGQIITCVFIGIFFGFVYLKTNNIWICVCMHFLNNNLIPIFTGTFTADVMQNQHVPWFYLIEIFVLDLVVFGLFIFAKEYRKKKEVKTADA